jgi:hypothetical protein
MASNEIIHDSTSRSVCTPAWKITNRGGKGKTAVSAMMRQWSLHSDFDDLAAVSDNTSSSFDRKHHNKEIGMSLRDYWELEEGLVLHFACFSSSSSTALVLLSRRSSLMEKPLQVSKFQFYSRFSFIIVIFV